MNSWVFFWARTRGVSSATPGRLDGDRLDVAVFVAESPVVPADPGRPGEQFGVRAARDLLDKVVERRRFAAVRPGGPLVPGRQRLDWRDARGATRGEDGM